MTKTLRLKNLFHIVLLGLISFSGIGVPIVKAQNTSPAFHSFRLINDTNSFLDTNSRTLKTTWQNGEESTYYNYFLFHKSGFPLSLQVNFSEKFKTSESSKISCVLVQNSDTLYLASRFEKDSTIQLSLSNPTGQCELQVRFENLVIAKLYIDVHARRKERIYIVPLVSLEIDEKDLSEKINAIFEPYNLEFEVQMLPEYFSDELQKNPSLNNPSSEFDHYTRQMREIRDAYFSDFPRSDKRAFYVFVHPGFVNKTQLGFCVRGKAVAFITKQSSDVLSYQIAVQLARGFGGLKKDDVIDLEDNLLNSRGGTALIFEQWRNLHLEYRGYSFYDDDEEINTFNGFVAYYFWEEDENGNIIFNPGAFRNAIQRPYKKNYFSYNLSIEKRLFKPIFSVFNIQITPLHFILLTLIIWIGFVLRSRFENRLSESLQNFLRIKKFMAQLLVFTVVGSLSFGTFYFMNKIIAQYEILEGKILDFKGLSAEQVRREILYNQDIDRSEKPEMATEVLIKKGDDWIVKRRKRVLYFDQFKDSTGVYSIAKFNRESDSITLPEFGLSILAPSHYFVVNRINDDGKYESQQVYNHQGSNVTHFLQVAEEPAKRILVFVNGYRPTSLGSSLEENFRDILERGVEFPNSKNMIHNFDRYDYWRPWREIDLKFEKRVNPSETYYADGHFSVSTSNYRSLIHFTQVSTKYPSRCKDPENHICLEKGQTSWFKSSNKATHRLLPNRPNYKGFKTRRENGRIAGLNLLQQLNELPNSSHNDTLFIVAHSMGYAYALGMIDELRGKINFGGFYILAPENAEAGKINASEWQEIYQYGVNHEKFEKTAPCMLDGVAPQIRAQGLEPEKHIFIPENLFRRFGFFDSHFVGFYDWIFDIPQGETGAIKQR